MQLNGNWKRFEAMPQERLFSRVHVTINHKGQIHLGRNAHELFGRPRAVTLYFEPDLGKIALEPADVRQRGSIKLVAKSFGAYYLSAMPFCRRNNIVIVGTHAFREPEINHNGIMVLDLNDTQSVGGWVSKATAEKYRDRFKYEKQARELIAEQAARPNASERSEDTRSLQGV